MRPARFRPLLVEAARRERRDCLAVGGDANEMRGAGSDLHGDDLSVAPSVGIVDTAIEGDAVLMGVALDVKIGALLVCTRVIDLREKNRAVGERYLWRFAVATADVGAPAGETNIVRREAFSTRGAGVEDRRIREPARREDERPIVRELAPSWKRRGRR